MKIKNVLVNLGLTALYLIASANLVQAQTGNQSDITGPDVIDAIFPPPPQDPDLEIEEDTKEVTTADQAQRILDLIDESELGTMLETAEITVAIQVAEELSTIKTQAVLGTDLHGSIPSQAEISNYLSSLLTQTGLGASVNYVNIGPSGVTINIVLPAAGVDTGSINQNQLVASKESEQIMSQFETSDSSATRTTLPVSQEMMANLDDDIEAIRAYMSNPLGEEEDYLEVSARLYDLVIRPMTDSLDANNLDVLVFVMGDGLRGIPLAALYNRETGKYLIEEYGVAIIPSFGLTDVSYEQPDFNSILAMGSSTFTAQSDLPSVPIELNQIISPPRDGTVFLNQDFTINNFKNQNLQQEFDIIHLGTHAKFNRGEIDQSYIQFFDNKLSIPDLIKLSSELQWDTLETNPIELLVLSACETSVGSPQAELGFAGIAIASGVKSVLASLWEVSDLGTLALMSQFYENYTAVPLKAEALRQAQLSLLRGEVYIEEDEIVLASGSRITIPEEFQGQAIDFSHPFIWGAFQIIGNWN